MRMLKNDIPMLEYDFHPAAVIMPDRENLDLKLPAKAVFAFLGEAVDQYAQAHHAEMAAHFVSAKKHDPA